MRTMRVLFFAAAATLAGCATASGATEPLGTLRNPVQAQSPQGERAYLDRLRCPNGSPPAYERRGSGGPARDGHPIDFYAVTCAGTAPVTVVMDMYHSGSEDRPVPGFTIVPRDGRRQ